jgi:hypothetical protein
MMNCTNFTLPTKKNAGMIIDKKGKGEGNESEEDNEKRIRM